MRRLRLDGPASDRAAGPIGGRHPSMAALWACLERWLERPIDRYLPDSIPNLSNRRSSIQSPHLYFIIGCPNCTRSFILAFIDDGLQSKLSYRRRGRSYGIRTLERPIFGPLLDLISNKSTPVRDSKLLIVTS
jgi:hypothetical protein